MKLFGWSRKSQGDVLSIDQVIRRFEAVNETISGETVTPENCERSPTVKAIITATTRRIGVSPVHVYRKTIGSNGRATKEPLPSHPVARLLSNPNGWQTPVSFWMDATSWLLRYGNFYAFKGQGNTGPIRRLTPLQPGTVEPKQDSNWDVTYRLTQPGGGQMVVEPWAMLHARMVARDGLIGDSPINDVREAIALEIAAERFGGSYFGNGAMPGVVLEYQEGSQGFKSDQERQQFIQSFREQFNNRGRFKALLPPLGIKIGQQIPVENEKAQFIQLRQYQRTVIAGAFGIPPHLVGDLSKGTYNNVEQQDIGFTTNAVLPIVRCFESAMERDLLTREDRRDGVVIRFNLDGVLRGSFKERQEGLAIQRQNGAINANEWREHEGMNPRPDPGGEEYYATGPSGQTPSSSATQDAPPPAEPDGDDTP